MDLPANLIKACPTEIPLWQQRECDVRIKQSDRKLPEFMPLRFIFMLSSASTVAMPAFAHNSTSGAEGAAFELDALIVVFMGVAIGLYAIGLRRLWGRAHTGAGISRRQALWFLTGWILLAVALLSPVDTLGDELFSMHMLQHELMMLGAAPLLVAGRPLAVFLWGFGQKTRQRIARFVKMRAIQRTWSGLTRPATAWTLHMLILWAWHFPSLFQASLANDWVHALQHFSFLASALLFWSALIGPQHAHRHFGGSVLYVLTTAIHTGILGALLTFSPYAWYPAYAGKTEAWGLSLLEDQQLGGLIMWVPAGFVLILAGMLFAARAIAPQPSRLANTAAPLERRP